MLLGGVIEYSGEKLLGEISCVAGVPAECLRLPPS